MKIKEKVSSSKIASEASYSYNLSEQKFIKKIKNGPFWLIFENLKLAIKQCYQTGSYSITQKRWKLHKMSKLKWDILSDFQTTWNFENQEIKGRQSSDLTRSIDTVLIMTKEA